MFEVLLSIAVALGATGAVVVGLAGALPDVRKAKREIATHRVRPLSTLIDGARAAVRGDVVPGPDGLVAAPLSGRACVCWMLEADGDRKTRQLGGNPFMLRDKSGTAKVVPVDAVLAVGASEHSSGVTEYAVLPGSLVTIVGWCTFEPDPDNAGDVKAYRNPLPVRRVISGTRRKPLLIG